MFNCEDPLRQETKTFFLPWELRFFSCIALAFTKSFASLVSLIVGLFVSCGKITNQLHRRLTRHANDFVNAKSHAREKPDLLARCFFFGRGKLKLWN